jgi:hypothetical protein
MEDSTVTSPQETETSNRLERIFHPYALRQMEDFAKKQRDQERASFVHYTSAEAALGILESKRLWMLDVTAMPDYGEVRVGFDLLNEVLFGGKKEGLTALNEALEPCAPGAADEAIQCFNTWWSDIQFNTYITSISEHDESEDQHGRLSMWRAFGRTDVRVAIVAKFPFSLLRGEVFNVVVSPVAYLNREEVWKEFQGVVKNICDNRHFLKSIGRERIVNSVYNMLVTGVTCLKHEGFKEEREWRLVYAPKRWPSPLIECSTEVIKGTPQIVYKIPLDANAPGAPAALQDLDLARIFDHLIIGPALYPFSMIEAFATVLKNAGVPEPERRIVLSRIPIRM